MARSMKWSPDSQQLTKNTPSNNRVITIELAPSELTFIRLLEQYAVLQKLKKEKKIAMRDFARRICQAGGTRMHTKN